MDDLQNNIQPAETGAPTPTPVPTTEPEPMPMPEPEPATMQPQSLEEISGTNPMPETESPDQSVSSSDTSEMLKKIILPIVIALVLGLGGYLVYAYVFSGSEAAPEQTDIEDFTTTPVADEISPFDTTTPIDTIEPTDTTEPSSTNSPFDTTTPSETPSDDTTTTPTVDTTEPTTDTTEPTEDQPIKIPRS